MGLSGRKVKQRIPNDPRNLAWSENAAKFGHTYLSKLGWDPSLGLGIAGDGRTTNIAVAQKLDQLGIGAGRGAGGTNDKDGVAWKQQNEFEQMLARLNQQGLDGATDGEGGKAKEGVVSALGFVASSSTSTSTPNLAISTEAEEVTASSLSKENKDKKRKRSQVEASETSSKDATTVTLEVTSSTATVASITKAPAAPVPRRFAHHRARLLNAKKISAKSAAELSEVLGIPSTPGSSSSTPTPGMGTLTPISDEPDTKITTSTKSMSDYFKEKMAKMKNKHSWMTDGEETPKARSDAAALIDTTAAAETGLAEEEDERPRFGLGAGRRAEAPSSSAFATPNFQPSTVGNADVPSMGSTSKPSLPSFAPSSSKLGEVTSSSSDEPSSSKAKGKKDRSEKKPKKRSKSSDSDNDDDKANKSKSKKEKRKDKAAATTVVLDASVDVESQPTAIVDDDPAGADQPPRKKKKRSKDSDDDDEARRKRKEEKKAKKRAKEGKI